MIDSSVARRARRGLALWRNQGAEIRPMPAGAARPEGARDLLEPLEDLYADPPSASEIRDRVLAQLKTGRYGLDS